MSPWQDVAMDAWGHLEVILKNPPAEFHETFLDEIRETVNKARAIAGLDALSKTVGGTE